MEYVLLHLRWENMLRGVVRKGIAQFSVAFSYGFALSRHASKKILSHFILLYFACWWDFSGTSVHTWSVSQFLYLCSWLLQFSEQSVDSCLLPCITFFYIWISCRICIWICTFFTLVWKLPNPHRNIIFIVPSLSAVTLCKCLCDFAVISLYFLLFSANNYNSRQT
jgi:hypothetical protein